MGAVIADGLPRTVYVLNVQLVWRNAGRYQPEGVEVLGDGVHKGIDGLLRAVELVQDKAGGGEDENGDRGGNRGFKRANAETDIIFAIVTQFFVLVNKV